MANAAKANGVTYISGGDGHVKKLIYDKNGTCVGVIAENGTVHQADIIVLASGANTATLVEAKEEVVAQTAIICVIKLEPDEVEKYKNIPIIDDFEQGMYYTPRATSHVPVPVPVLVFFIFYLYGPMWTLETDCITIRHHLPAG